MKYVLIQNLDWDYDDLNGVDSLILSIPDDFDLHDESFFEKYLQYKNFEYKKLKTGSINWFQVNTKPDSKRKTFWHMNTTRVLENDTELRKDFLLWLRQYGVEVVPFEYFE